MASRIIRVAIIGGGLAGTILMNALAQHAHLDVQLYEAKTEIQERGASIGLARNARRALRLMGLGEVVKRAKGVRVGSSLLIMGEGRQKGAVVRDTDFDTETVHRASLLRELLVPIAQGSIHLNRQLASIDGNTINFADGSSVFADVIIGADGIHSTVRKYVLGIGHQSVEPVPAGFWDIRAIVSHDEAVSRLGKSCIDNDDPRQHMHTSDKGVLFHDIIDDAQRVCIVASGPIPSDWSEVQWRQVVSREWLDALYAGWGDFGQNGLDLLCGDKKEMQAFVQWESAKAPKLYNKTTCMMGDAAHATTPWLGSGLSQAIEDALILDKVLGRCSDLSDIPLALEAYDRVRRDHARTVVDDSRKTAEAYFGPDGLDVESLREKLPSRDCVLNWDTQGAIEQAIENFEQLRKANDGPS